MHDYGLLCFVVIIQDVEASIRDDMLVDDHSLEWLTQTILIFKIDV